MIGRIIKDKHKIYDEVDAGSQEGLATFSPDGKWVAFLSSRSGDWAVWVPRLDGTGLSKLFDLPAPPTLGWTEEHIAWEP